MELTGRVQAGRILSHKFLIGGTLSQVNVSVGQSVKKGQLLSRIDQTELQAYLDRALKYYEQVRADFDEKQGKSRHACKNNLKSFSPKNYNRKSGLDFLHTNKRRGIYRENFP